MDLIFNDLSSVHPANTLNQARERMEKLIQLIRFAKKSGTSSLLYAKEDLLIERIGPSYRISDWMNDQSIDKELRLYWLNEIDRLPYVQLPDEQFLIEELYLHEFRHQDEQADGLGMAYFREGLSISFDSHPKWNTPNLILNAKQMQESGEIHEKEISIKHANAPVHLDEHKEFLSQKLAEERAIQRASIKNGKDLVVKSAQLFTSIKFCDRALGQLQEIQRGDSQLKSIIKKLFELEVYFSTWNGIFDAGQLNHCTPESETNLNKYEKDYSIQCPDGTYQLFSWHIRFTPGAGRIYFIPDSVSRKVIIGHIGTKIGD